MIKYYGRYWFPSDPIVDYCRRLIYIALNITWNNLQWRLYFFMNDWGYMCDFEHDCPFWYKTTRKYSVKFRPIVTPVISYSIANFLMQCLGMPSERFLAWTRKNSPTFLRHFRDVCVPRVPWRSTWRLMCCFLIATDARQILTMACKVLGVPFDWGIYI